MQTRNKIILGVLALLIAFASGRWLAPEKVKTEVKTVYVEKKTETTNEKKHTETIVTEKPDGTKETHIVEDDNKNTKDLETSSTTRDRTKEITRGSSKLTISAMAGIRPFDSSTPIYGASLSKPILGPVTVGLWGLSNGTLGASAGLTF